MRVVEELRDDGDATGLLPSAGTTRSPSLSQSARGHSLLHTPTIDPELSLCETNRASSLMLEEDKSHDQSIASADFGKAHKSIDKMRISHNALLCNTGQYCTGMKTIFFSS